MVVLFIKLLYNYSERFDEVENNYLTTPKSAVNLVKGVSYNDLTDVLHNHNYITSKDDADFVSKFISQKLDDGQSLSTLYDLNKRIWQIPVSLIDSIGSSVYKNKADKSKESIGIDDEFCKKDFSQLCDNAKLDSNQYGSINVSVEERLENSGMFSKSTKPCANIVVRLSVQYIDSLDNYKSKRRTLAYLKTNDKGEVSFNGLNPNLSYSVLPIKDGFEYGISKGTIGGNLSVAINKQRSLKDKLLGRNKNTLLCSFTQQEHKIRIFDAQTLRQIKEDKTLTIRSPKEFKNILVKYVVLFFAAWWGLWLIYKVRRKPINETILAILMSLTGLCLLTMFSLNDPLTDKLLGVDMAQGIIAGVVLIAILLNVNFKKLYQNQALIDFDIPLECIKWIFKPFKHKVSYLTRILSNRTSNVFLKCISLCGIVICLPMLILDLIRATSLNKIVSRSLEKLPKGSGYLLTALMLTALLFTPLGVAVGGMKVNLNIGILFQPSEIAKYLIIFFMAAFFSVNANKIVQFSEKGNTKLFGAKLKMMMSIFIGLGVLMGLYLVLGDMGPALVLAFTFIFLYSIIKSKIDLEGTSLDNQLKRIFTCDIAMLIYGVLSFIVFLYIGNFLGNMGVFCLAWFALWIIIGVVKQEIYETPIFFNFIITAFIFGGTLLGYIPGLGNVAERLDDRNEMCSNTWGTLPIDGNIANAGENTQVAEGLWGLASGGFWGQGLGNGSTHFIPAFHTDMILESIGEQMGFVGIFIIILLLAILLRRTIVVGYETSHPFTFYLCLGIAIVTAIQFVIISLGSTGIIPLTGVTVPFLSYGKVSMILNLAAFGIILSIASHSATETTKATETTASLIKQNIGKYNYSVSLLSWTYCILAIFICSVFFYYQFIDRNDTLIRPVYVNNSSGIPIVEYNPRIEQLTEKMYSGDIYDRNGVLLATNNPSRIDDSLYKEILGDEYNLDLNKRQRRYYPFGAHLAFMLGDRNSDLFIFNGSESSGYVAETRHLSELRGYNLRIDEDGKELPTVILSTDSMQIDRWHSKYNYKYKDSIKLLNYSALIPYLKEGVNSDRVEDFNNRDESWWNLGKIKPKDIHLTIDAALQTSIQKRMKEWIPNHYKESLFRNRIRASVVIVDAENGDLLTSAVYPLPNSERLKSEVVNGKLLGYHDKHPLPQGWESYTDVDLGLIYNTAPGSTAKIMSALAGLQKCGIEAASTNNNNYKYHVSISQFAGSIDAEFAGHINMFEAIWRSSNCYFINLVNDYELYPNLFNVYRTVGVQLGYSKPYGLFYPDSTMLTEFNKAISKYRVSNAIETYRKYIEDNSLEPMKKDLIWQWAWGQGDLAATPLTMARVASIVANDGIMRPTRFLMNDKIKDGIQIVTKAEAEALGKAMVYEAENHTTCKIKSTNNTIGGKTGTANRHIKNRRNQDIQRSNDSWYICYIKPSTKEKRPLAVAVRIERGQSSINAKELVKSIVLDELKKYQYIK